MTRRAKLEAMIEKNPRDAFLHFGIAMELVKEGATDAALDRFDQAMEIDPNYVAAYFLKSQTLIAAKRFDEARAVLRAGMDAAKRVGEDHAHEEMQGVLDSIS